MQDTRHQSVWALKITNDERAASEEPRKCANCGHRIGKRFFQLVCTSTSDFYTLSNYVSITLSRTTVTSPIIGSEACLNDLEEDLPTTITIIDPAENHEPEQGSSHDRKRTQSHSSTSEHNERIRQLAQQYEKRGYTIKADHIDTYSRPPMVNGWVPDLLAMKDDQRILFEIETPESKDTERSQEQHEAFRDWAENGEKRRVRVIHTGIRPRNLAA